MADYMVTCCSTADLSAEYLEAHQIPYICFHYLLDGKEYPDDLGKTTPFDKFYQMITDGAMPTTSQVNQQAYCDFWEPFLKEGKDVLHLSLSGGLSGSVNSASNAASLLMEEYPDRKIIVIDSLAASSGFGLLVGTAARKRDEGVSLEDNAAWVEANKLRLHHWFFSTDLTSFIRGGRVSKVSGFFGTALKICPLLNVNSEGKLIPRLKIRTKKKVSQEMVNQMEIHAEKGLDYDGEVFLSHSACYEDARYVADMIQEKFPKISGPIRIFDIGTVIGSHTGPGTVALFFYGDEREL